MKKLCIITLSIALSCNCLFGKMLRENATPSQSHTRDQEDVRRFAEQITSTPGINIPASLQPNQDTILQRNAAGVAALRQNFIQYMQTAQPQAGQPQAPTQNTPRPTTRVVGVSSSRERDINTPVRHAHNDLRFVDEARNHQQARVALTIREGAHREGQPTNGHVQEQSVTDMINQLFPTPSTQQQNDCAQRHASYAALLQEGREFVRQHQEPADSSDSEHNIEHDND